MVKKNKDKWVSIFWIESCEISIVSCKDISEVLKPTLIRVGWCGDLPWVDRYGITTLYEAKLLKISLKHHRHKKKILVKTAKDHGDQIKTSENMNKNNPNIRNAIIGYLKSECDVSLTVVEFNDIVRRKIDQAVLNQKPLDEIQKIKIKNIERALTSRSKRKLLSKQNSSIVSKKIKDSDDTLVIESFLHLESKDRDGTSQKKTNRIINKDLPIVNTNDNHEQSTESFIRNDITSARDKGTDVFKESEIGNQQDTNKIEQAVSIGNLEEDKTNGLEEKTNHQQDRPVKESATNLEQPKDFSANDNCPNPPFSQLESNTQTSLLLDLTILTTILTLDITEIHHL